MTSTRRLLYTALLALSTLSLAPSLAHGQEPVRGQFTLPHDVRWGDAFVPAGEYRFALQPEGPVGVLFLNKLSGKRTGFMLPVRGVEEAKPSILSQLVLENTAEGSYVSTMQLPEFGVTLRFSAPSYAGEKQLAAAVTASSAGAP